MSAGCPVPFLQEMTHGNLIHLHFLVIRHQNAGQNHDIKIGNRWFENVAQFRYLGTTITSDCHNIPAGSDKEIIFKTFCKIVPIHLTLKNTTGNRLYEMWEWSRSLQ
jgi:hypothetical protein